MYQIGEAVVYGTTGVCTVQSIGPLSMRGVDRHRQYYTLQPVHADGAVYVPLGDDGKPKVMRYPITEEEAHSLISRIPEIEPCDIKGMNYKQRTDTFNAALHQNNCESLVMIIKTIDKKKHGIREKQQYNADNTYMKRAMNLLCGELAYVLDVSTDEIRDVVENAVRAVNAAESV